MRISIPEKNGGEKGSTRSLLGRSKKSIPREANDCLQTIGHPQHSGENITHPDKKQRDIGITDAIFSAHLEHAIN